MSVKFLLVLRPTRTSGSSVLVRNFPILYCFNLTGIHMNAVIIDYMPKELHFLYPEFTLRKLIIQLLLLEQLQNKLQMNLVILLRLRVDHDIIDKHDDELV
ncbi:hypothetical protein Tco_1048644 [Tanacetum coccineum]